MCGVMLCSEKNMFRMGKRVFSLNQTLVFLSAWHLEGSITWVWRTSQALEK
uniref:Uncharacterized protein n=1 Tax=Triticum urartu TaxID=4572 RepID=A0A8R7UXJ1_TRIUA